jgi:hypothetical protein
MTKHRTGTSSSYGDIVHEEPTGGVQARATRPGLVLLYAPNFDQFYPSYVFSVPQLIIGRDPGNPICVPEQAVSRQHARILFDGRRWMLHDLGSRNGTMVDGQSSSSSRAARSATSRTASTASSPATAGPRRWLTSSAAARWTPSPPTSSASGRPSCRA